MTCFKLKWGLIVVVRVHNKNRERECLTANASCTKSLHIMGF